MKISTQQILDPTTRSQHSTRRTSILAAAFLTLAFAGPETGTAAGSSQPAPFHAVSYGNANPIPTGQCTLSNHETGVLMALELGQLELVQFDATDDETVQLLGCPPQGSAATVSGEFTWAAANGDRIKGKYQTFATLDPVNGVSFQRSFKIVHGTGQFVGITGLGTLVGYGTPSAFVAALNGTISMPAK